MRLLAVLLLAFGLQLSAGSIAQTITYSGKKVSLESVFSSVEKQTGYVFFYDAQLVQKAGTVSVEAKAMALDQFLGLVFKTTPLKYTIKEKTIVVSEKNGSTSSKKVGALLETEAPPIDITGKVIDENGNPLTGASVRVKGTALGASTDANGVYLLKGVPSDATLVISFIGYESKETEVNNRTSIEIQLMPEMKAMQEVFVGALGINRDRRTSTYAAQKVQGNDLRASNQPNLVNALQGQIAGAQISSSGGSPGLPSEIILRGVSSLTGDNQPLIIMDGIRISNASSNGTLNRLGDINPEDIEDITILKGASAAALYGIDAASGALIITTKKGKAGKINMNASVKTFAETVGRLPRQQKIYTTGINGVFDESTTTSWGRKFRADETIYDNPQRFFQTGLVNDINFNLNGGTDKLNFYMSGNYRGGTATIPNTRSDRMNILLKGFAKLSNKLDLTTQLQFIDNSIQEGLVGSNSGGWANSIYRYPLRYDINNYELPNGDPNYEFYQEGVGNPSAILSPMWGVMRNPRNTNTRRTIMSAYLNYNLTDWLKFNYRIGQDFYNQDYGYKNVPGTPGSWQGRLFESNGNFSNITSTFNAIINKKILSDFDMTVILGSNNEYYWGETKTISGEFFQNPDIPSVNVIEPININISEGMPRRRRYGAYGDVKLEYKKIFSLSYTGRNDWSSTLPANARSFYFSSFGGAFVFTELLNNRGWFGKLRATRATVGKDAPIYRTNSNLTRNQGVGGGFVNDPTGGNPNLKPEVTTETEIGLELRGLRNRLSLDVTYYNARSRDQIVSARVPLTTGFVIQTFNAGSIHNRGVEISLSGTPIKRKNFDWNVTINGWQNRSTMLELPDQVRVFPYTFGQPFTAAIAASAINRPVLGIVGTDYLRNEDGFIVVNDEGYPIINSEESQLYIGNREPRWNFGLINKFHYKNFALSFLWDFRFGGDVYNATRLGMMSGGISEDIGEWRDRSFVFNGVVKQHDGTYRKNTREVVLNYNYFASNYYAVGTNFIERVNWARMRYITLGYNLPKAFAQRLKVNNVSLELGAQNLLLITNYSGGDPEVNSAGPNSGGAEGGSTMGVDFGAIPLTRGYSFGVNINF